MEYYVFLWNPDKDRGFTDDVAAFRDGTQTVFRWSCGNATSIAPGDMAILRKTGAGPKGIIGIGEVVTDVTVGQPRTEGGTGNSVGITWELLALDPIVSADMKVLAGIDRLWTAQAGGTRIAKDDGEAVFAAVRDAGFWSFVPTTAALVTHWRAHVPTETRRKMLAAHYWSPEADMRPSFLSAKMGWTNASSAHLNYGGFAGDTAKDMGIEVPIGSDNVALFAGITGIQGDRRWRMHDQIRHAIEALGWHREFVPDTSEEDLDRALFAEGRAAERKVTIRERNASVREHCLAAHGAVCAACGFDPVCKLGADFAGLMDVHHLHPVANGGERTTDPATDCRPLCPTCHRLAHHGMPHGQCRSIDVLKRLRS